MKTTIQRSTARRSTAHRALALGAAVLLAAGCSSQDDTAEAGPAADSAVPEAASLTIEEPWVKAADDGMTAAFGTLRNEGDTDVTVVSATTPVSSTMELHEMAMSDGAMVMRPKDGGFVIPAGGDHLLDPGSDHLMFMDLSEPVQPGDDVQVTLTLDDGSTMDFTAQAKEFSGAEEEYEPAGEMDMGATGSSHGG